MDAFAAGSKWSRRGVGCKPKPVVLPAISPLDQNSAAGVITQCRLGGPAADIKPRCHRLRLLTLGLRMIPARSASFLPRATPEQRASPWTFRLAVLGVVLGTLAITMEAVSLASRLAPYSADSGGLTAALPQAPRPEEGPPPSPPPPQESTSTTAPDDAIVAATTLDSDSATAVAAASSTTPQPTSALLVNPSLLDAAEDRMLGPRAAEETLSGGNLSAYAALQAAEPRVVASSTGGAGEAGPPVGRRKGRGGKGAGWGRDGNSGVSGGGAGGASLSGERPHIVLMVADDADLADISAYRASSGGAAARVPRHQAVGGAPHGLTPNLDAVARRGVSFYGSYAAAPLCAPSRFALLTGSVGSCAASATSLRTVSGATTTPTHTPPTTPPPTPTTTPTPTTPATAAAAGAAACAAAAAACYYYYYYCHYYYYDYDYYDYDYDYYHY